MSGPFLFVTWVGDVAVTQHISKLDEASRGYFGCLHPFGEPIEGPHFPTTILGEQQHYEVRKRDLTCFRDGWLPLTCFFQNATPEDFSGRIGIPANLWFVVPPEWRARVELYRTVPTAVFDRERTPKKVFLAGGFSPAFTDLGEFQREVLFLAEVLGGPERLKDIEVSALFTSVDDHFWSPRTENQSLHGASIVMKNIKADISFLTVDKVFNLRSFENTLYHEFNRGRFIADSMIKQFVLTRGGGLMANSLAMDGFIANRKMAISPYANVELMPWQALQIPKEQSLLPADCHDFESFMIYFKHLKRQHALPRKWIEFIGANVASKFNLLKKN
jgi:hypothetical protein